MPPPPSGLRVWFLAYPNTFAQQRVQESSREFKRVQEREKCHYSEEFSQFAQFAQRSRG
jgi:hypothetical protein